MLSEALARTTILSIAAHQDDIEIMACDGIVKCFRRDDEWFTGVVVTNGLGSTRSGIYSSYSEDEIQVVRKLEQKKAAFVGEYAAQFLLDYSSSETKDPRNSEIIKEIREIISRTRPNIIYTHNLVDKHETHLATALKVIWAIRELPKELRPKRLYGCEVWRDLDWLSDSQKIIFDLSAHENISASLLGVYDSQINGGKRYDLATMGRRRANATFCIAEGIDTMTAVNYAMDLSPLVEDDGLDIKEYIVKYIREFEQHITDNIDKLNYEI